MANTKRKVGTSLLISPITRDRLIMLAVVRQESQAEVSRALLEKALPGEEARHKLEIARLGELATRFGMKPAELAEKMLEDGFTLEALEVHGHYPMSDQPGTTGERVAAVR